MKKLILPMICAFFLGWEPVVGLVVTGIYLMVLMFVLTYRDCKRTDKLLREERW